MKIMHLFLLVLCTIFVCCSLVQAKGWKPTDFMVTMWCPPPPDEENFRILKRDGYNLTMISLGGDAETATAEALKLLDIAQKNGIKSMLSHPLIHWSSLDDPTKKAELDKLIDGIKKHPALDGYHLTDEPQATTFPSWAKITAYLREKDPEHLSYINLFPTYANQQQLAVFLTEEPKGPVGIPDNFAGAGTSKQTIVFYNEHLRLFVEQVKPELISYDHYHFLKNGRDGDQYFLNIALIRAAAMKAKVPFLNIVQACTIEPSWRLVNENELRWLAYTTMAYGARGISWFLYWGPVHYGGLYQEGQRMPLADQVARVNQDITALGPELMKLASTEVYHTEPLPTGTQSISDGCPVKVTGGQFVVGMFKSNNIENTFMVMNRNYKGNGYGKATLNLGNGKLMEFSIEKRKWIEAQQFVQDGTIVDFELVPGGGKLFKVVK